MKLKGILAGSVSALAISAAIPVFAADGATEIVVTGIRASTEKALEIKRNASTILDAVSAEDIGKLPDKNVADALQRVPGVTTFSQASGEGGFDENDRVAVRGTNPSLTNTMVDGHTVATGDWFILDQFQTVGRSVSFALFPAEIVSSVNVYKSQEADLVEGGTAGSVDIVTRKPLDFAEALTFEGSLQGVYADLPNKTDPQVNAMFAWHNEAGTIGILAQGFYEQRHLRRDGQEFLGYSTITAAANPHITAAHPDLNNVLYPTLIGAALFEQERKRTGGDISIEFKPTDAFEVTLSSFYSHLAADNFNNNFMAWVSHEIGDDNVPTSYAVNNGTLVKASFPGVNAATSAPELGVVEDSIYRPGAAAQTWYTDADFNAHLSPAWTLHGKIGYTEGKGVTPSQPTWESDAVTPMSYDMSSGVAAVSLPGIDPSNPADMSNDWAWSDKFTAVDKEFYTQADIEYDVNDGVWQSIKFGARYADHTRDVVGYDKGSSFALTSSAVSSGAHYPSDFGSTFSIPGFLSNIWLPDTGKIQQIVMPAVTPYVGPAGSWFYWPGSFRTEEKDWAAYAQANFKGQGWRGNVGLRYVNTSEDVLSYVSDTAGTANAYGNFDAVSVKHTYKDPLPSANLTIDLDKDQLLRFAVARTMSRPDYSALGGSVSLNDTIHTGTGGNPDLVPIRAWTYDASWEWYFGKASLLSVGLFYMDFTDYVTFGVHDATYLDATATGLAGHPIYASYSITSPANTKGKDQGLEASWQQPVWGGFGLITNFTYADGKEQGGGPLIGDAKETYNIQGYYENDWLSARLAYTWRDHVLIGLDRSTAENQQSIGDLDASVDVSISKNATLTFDALNLTDELLKYYANNTSQPRAIYDNGRQFFVGVRIKM